MATEPRDDTLKRTLAHHIQGGIIVERNNYGDHSVSGDDLRLAVAAALLLYERGTLEQKARWLSEAGLYEPELMREMPLTMSLRDDTD